MESGARYGRMTISSGKTMYCEAMILIIGAFHPGTFMARPGSKHRGSSTVLVDHGPVRAHGFAEDTLRNAGTTVSEKRGER